MLMLLMQIIGTIATAVIVVYLLKKDWRTKNEAIRKEAVLVTRIIMAVTAVSILNLGISYWQSQIDINRLEKDKRDLAMANANLSSGNTGITNSKTGLAALHPKKPVSANNSESKKAPVFRFILLPNHTLAGTIINKDAKPVYNLSLKITNYDNLSGYGNRKVNYRTISTKNFVSNTIYSPTIASLHSGSVYYLKLPKFNKGAAWGRYVLYVSFNKKTYYEEAIYSYSRRKGLQQALRIIEYNNNSIIHKTAISSKEYQLKKVNWDGLFPLPINLPAKKPEQFSRITSRS